MKHIPLILLLLLGCAQTEVPVAKYSQNPTGDEILFTRIDWELLPEYDYYRYSAVPYAEEGFERWGNFPVMITINRYNGDTMSICKVDTVEHPYATHWGDAKSIKPLVGAKW